MSASQMNSNPARYSQTSAKDLSFVWNSEVFASLSVTGIPLIAVSNPSPYKQYETELLNLYTLKTYQFFIFFLSNSCQRLEVRLLPCSL